MKFLEKNLEQIIFESDRKQLSERGLTIYGRLYRQLRIGNYGIADLVEFERYRSSLKITVYELKNELVGINALQQAVGYLSGIECYLNLRGVDFFDSSIVLIGANIEKNNNFCFFGDIFSNLSIYEYKYTLTGLEFSEVSGYSLTKKGFKPKLNINNIDF